MHQFTTPAQLITYRKSLDSTQIIGFVPTMGNLHEGHLSLIEQASAQCDIVIMSIFVNPTQFNNNNDFQHYPKTLEHDIDNAKQAGVDVVFMPFVDDIYPNGYHFKVCESKLSLEMEGAYRAGHFDGVLTVVLKLFNLIRPHKAFFGEKDYQQLQLVKKMSEDFFLGIDVVACPTVRAQSGLALSSRNHRLSPEQKLLAPKLYEIVCLPINADAAKAKLTEIGFMVDYVEDKEGRRFVAASLGEVRLIDNIPLSSEVCDATRA